MTLTFSCIFQSEILSEFLYQTEWYNLEEELKKDLILVILRARRAICLNAGPFGAMTYVMMLAVSSIQ